MTSNSALLQKICIQPHITVKFTMMYCMLFAILSGNAQIGIGTNKPDSSAALHISDTARGLLIPRVTTKQKNAIRNPAEGLMIYQTDSIRGFWYFTGGQWKNMVPANDGGKQTIVLSGNITDSVAAAKITAEYGINTQVIRIAWCNNLTKVDLSMLTNATEISIYSNSLLKTVNLSSLVSVESFFRVKTCPSLTSITLTSLQTIAQGSADNESPGFTISYCGLTSLAFPQLKEIAGNFVLEYNDSLKTIHFLHC